jgi:hypothetical protein
MNTGVASDRRPNGVFVSPFACLLFGVATLVSLIASLTWSGDEGWWGPGVSAILAWGLFALHLAFSARRLSAFDPGLWVPVNMLLYYFSVPIVVNLSSVYVSYDVWKLSDGVPPQLDRAFVVALLSLVAFLLGFHIGGFRNYNLRIETRSLDRLLFFPGLVLTFGGLGMTAFGTMLAGPGVILGAYGEMTYTKWIGGFDPRLVFSGFYFAKGGIFALLATYDGSRRFPLVYAAIGSALLAFFLLAVGDRGGLAGFIFSAGWVFTVQVRRLPKSWIIPPFLVALLLMPLIKEYRQFKTTEESQRMSVGMLARSVLTEMGSSYQVFCYTLEHIPKDKDYDYGMSFVAAAIESVPNLGLTTGKSFGLDALKHNPSMWHVWFVNPLRWRMGGGLGYTIGAEWYFNFGIPGVCLGMIATGYLMARIRNAARRGGLMLVCSGIGTSAMVLITRNNVMAMSRFVVWTLIGVVVLRYAFSTLGMGAPAPRSDASATAGSQRGSDDPAMPAPPSTL